MAGDIEDLKLLGLTLCALVVIRFFQYPFEEKMCKQ